jgi:hypothetical protein
MSDNLNKIGRLDFLLGKWELKFRVPKSKFSTEDSGDGKGEFKKILNNNYITFEYTSKLSGGISSAKGIFAWDNKENIYKYWWFEDSGNFTEAACDFINDSILSLNWYNSILVQTFKRLDNNNILLEMKYPNEQGTCDLILEVKLIRSE